MEIARIFTIWSDLRFNRIPDVAAVRLTTLYPSHLSAFPFFSPFVIQINFHRHCECNYNGQIPNGRECRLAGPTLSFDPILITFYTRVAFCFTIHCCSCLRFAKYWKNFTDIFAIVLELVWDSITRSYLFKSRTRNRDLALWSDSN